MLMLKVELKSAAVQTQIMEIYPEEISVVLFYNMCATLISALVCLFAERDFNSWKLKPGVSLVAVIYSVSNQTLQRSPKYVLISSYLKL